MPGRDAAVDAQLGARRDHVDLLARRATIVGANVTPSVGSTSGASRGSTSRTRCSSAASGSPASTPSAVEQRARGLGVDVEAGPALGRAAASTGASLSSALSASPGTEAWPAAPRARTREAEHALLGHADAVQAAVAERHHRAGALVEQPVAARRGRAGSRSATARRPRRRSPRRRPRSASASPRAGRQPARASVATATASAAVCDFMSMRAAAPEEAVDDLAATTGRAVQSSGSASTVSTWLR